VTNAHETPTEASYRFQYALKSDIKMPSLFRRDVINSLLNCFMDQ
jgi:hypothetical protein